MNVTVLDQQKRFINDLGREDFLVYENGIPQELTFFGAATVPVDVGLLIDLSSSMALSIDFLRQAAVGFIRTLRPGDKAAVTGFAGRSQLLQPLTGDLKQLEDAVRQARTGGSTALYDALYITLKELERGRKQRDEMRRQSVVVLSDGFDTASLTDGDDVLVAAQRSGVTVYVIRLQPPVSRDHQALLLNPSTSKADFILKRLGQDTGGRTFSPKSPADLAAVYTEIAAEIAQQYAIAYVPERRKTDGNFREVTVRVASRPDATVRTRRGYPSASSP